MSKSYKSIPRQTSADAAILDGCSEIECLKDEMEQWRDSLEEKFSSTDRYQRVSDAADTLGEFEANPDVPESIGGITVNYTEYQAYKGKSLSRATRLAAAIEMIQAGLSAVEERMEAIEGEKADIERRAADIRQEAEDKIEEAKDEAPTTTDDGEVTERPDEMLDADAIREDADREATLIENEIEGLDEEYEALEQFKDDMENAISEIGSVEFPGMYD